MYANPFCHTVTPGHTFGSRLCPLDTVFVLGTLCSGNTLLGFGSLCSLNTKFLIR